MLAIIVSNAQGNINIRALAIYVVGIERLRVTSFENVALATQLAVSQTLPLSLHICTALFHGRLFNIGCYHNNIEIVANL